MRYGTNRKDIHNGQTEKTIKHLRKFIVRHRTERRTMNHEGYQDPTAEKAVRRYNQMPYHMRRALTDLQDIASLFGFDIITIKDRRTGRKYRVEEKTDQ